MIHGNDAVGPIVLEWLNAGDRVGNGGKAAGDDAAAGGLTGLVSPSAEAERQVFRDWRHWRGSTCEFLILRVLRKEHADLRVELHHLRTLAAASAERHHGNRPDIPIIGELVEQLAAELAAHGHRGDHCLPHTAGG
jgi:iron-sulfur cluster repair protein YtfE (RIC family)